MIKIRLQRHGARHAPFYRMVVTPATTRRDGKFIEVLGTYNPQAHSRTEELKLKMERIDHWLGVGAQPTDTAKSLIRQGRLTPEEWLEKSEREATKRLARAQKGKSVPEAEAKSEEVEAPKEEAKKEEAPASEPEVKAEEKAPKAEAKSEEVEAPKEEAKKEEAPAAEPEEKAEEKAPKAEAKSEEVAAPKEKAKKEKASTAKPEAKAEENPAKADAKTEEDSKEG